MIFSGTSAMTKVTIDADTVAKLKDVREMVELRDETGKVVGHFLPGPPRDEHGKIIVPFSEEELDEMAEQKGGRPLKDILADLSKME
jgi:hypothetical protein